MRIYEIVSEARVNPDSDFLDQIEEIVDDSIADVTMILTAEKPLAS